MKRDAFDPIELRQNQAATLTAEAHKLVLQQLGKFGNSMSPEHSMALWQLMSGFTDQGLQIKRGRFAYALPCGAGKTESVIAWIAAQHQLGLGLSVAVSAQQVSALCNIKEKLIQAGVPECVIGIRHTFGKVALWRDTGDEERPIMLGTHSRIRGTNEMPPFCLYRGAPRDFLIWDESLISSDATVLGLGIAETALTHFTKGGKRPHLQHALERLQRAMQTENRARRASALNLLSEAESEAGLAELGRAYCSTTSEHHLFEDAKKALRLMKHTVSFLDVGAGDTGKGLMRYRIMVNPGLENIAVLDASFPVRELSKTDPTIVNRSTEAMRTFKSYEDVLVRQHIAPTGRCQFEGSKAERQKALQVAVNIIAGIPKNEPILVFTYKEERTGNLIDLFADELRAVEIDPEAKLPCGKQRISFSTWGKHTTDNSYAHCIHVLLLGVLRIPLLELGAAMAGQKDDLNYRMTRERLTAVEHSELASNILQAANRGCCRIVKFGKAMPMTIHLLTKEKTLQPLLVEAMPGLQWETIKPKADETASQLNRTQQATHRIVEFVQSLPSDVKRVSMKTIYKAIGVALGKDGKADAVCAALLRMHVQALLGKGSSWVRSGLSLVRRE